jgi:phosphatidylserine/phosphatidylglycerophosphate/cardiolipin synthase-like enzyme
MINEKLLARINSVVRELPPSLLDSVIGCLSIGANRNCDQEIKAQLISRVLVPKFRQLLLELIDTWCKDAPQVACSSVGAMLATAKYCERVRRSTSAELVWTGPDTSGGGLRRTGQALLQLINDTKRELIIVSFAVYRIPEIVAALDEAVTRGVGLRIIAETPSTDRESSIFSLEDNLGRTIMEKAKVFVWPEEKRPTNAKGKRGILHVKCAVADRLALFISSANLTANALRINMEMGILLHHPALADQLTRHVDALISEGTFELVSHGRTN